MRTQYTHTCRVCGMVFRCCFKEAVMCSRSCAAKSGKGKTGRKPKHGGTIGYALEPLYKIWSGIKQRCLQPTSNKYCQYGGRGIGICNLWQNDYLSFKRWSLQNGYATGLQIDRIDNDKGYSPENCRWVTPVQNCANRRTSIIFPNGETTAQVAERIGLSTNALRARLKLLDPKTAMTLPRTPNGGARKWFRRHHAINKTEEE